MDEIAPGLFHWTGFNPNIGKDVSSYFDSMSGTLLDPIAHPEGLDAVAAKGDPKRVILTNRHHHRDAGRFASRFGCEVLSNAAGLHEFADKPLEVRPIAPGEEIAAGVRALEMGTICPDDTVIHLSMGHGFLAFADSLVNYGGVGFVPDHLIGDDPEAVKAATYARAAALLDEDFDGLLFAHGDPIPSGGRRALREFVESAS